MDMINLQHWNGLRRVTESLNEEGARPLVMGVYQMRNHCNGEAGKEANLERMLSAIDAARLEDVQVLVMPEMCLPGYFTWADGTPEEAREANHVLADVPGESPYLRELQQACHRAGMVLTFGYGERDGEAVYNSIGVIDADGSWLGSRRKNPLFWWEYEEGSFAQPPRPLRSVVMRTRYAAAGIANCADGQFPESVRRMRLDGAEVLLWSNAAVGDPAMGNPRRYVEAGAHAITNRMWVACCNCVSENTTGTSLIVAPHGEPLLMLSSDREEMGVATVNLAIETGWEQMKQRLYLTPRPAVDDDKAASENQV
jgi:predicted amidohydrolase